MSDEQLVDLFLRAQAVEREIRASLPFEDADGTHGRATLGHAVTARKALESWVAHRSAQRQRTARQGEAVTSPAARPSA